MTILAEALGESLTEQRLTIYARELCDIDVEHLVVAFQRGRRECRFFPKIAELRELAGSALKDKRNVEAEAAWEFANQFLRKWGVDRMPIMSNGKLIEPSELPSRVQYALRRIGGLRGLNQITEEKRPFMFKDFCEAYALASIAESMTPQLEGKFVTDGKVKQLTAGARWTNPES